MDVQLSKKAKIAIVIVLFVSIAPLYLASNPGTDKIAKQLWDKADDTKTPEGLYKLMVFFDATWRDEKAADLAKEWLKHYGGDETEKDVPVRYQCWGDLKDRTFPYDAETMHRPPQRGEDFRPHPHPLTAKVLIRWASFLEDRHRLAEAVHIYTLLANEKYCADWQLTVDPESKKNAMSGVTRNGTGSRSF